MRVHQALSGLAILVVLICPAARAEEAKVGEVLNPGFEIDTDGDGIPDGWQRMCGSATARVDADTWKEGRRSLRLESAAGTDSHYEQAIAVQPGAVYSLSFWVKTKDMKRLDGVGICATASVRIRRGYLILERARDHAGTMDWAREAFDFLAPETGKVVVSLEYSSWGRAAGTVWYDDLRLERTAPPGGLGALAETPRGCLVAAEWALSRKPPLWTSLISGLEAYYATPCGRDLVPAAHLGALQSAAQNDPALRSQVVKLYGENAWRIPSDGLATPNLQSYLEEALQVATNDPKRTVLASTTRMGLARLTLIQGTEPIDAAVKAIQQGTGGKEDRLGTIVDAFLGDAAWLQSKKAVPAARRVLDALIAVVPAENSQRARVELTRLRFLRSSGEAPGAQQAAEQIAAPSRRMPPDARREALLALVNLAVEGGDLSQAQKWVRAADEQYAKDIVGRAAFHLEFAKALAAKQLRAQAIAECRSIVATSPQAMLPCYEGQRLLVQCLMDAGNAEEALGGAKILYGAAPNSEKEVTEAVNVVLRALRAKYQSVALANDFVVFQQHGPAGKDDKLKTEDDVEDPLASVTWTPTAEIDALFRKTLASLPEDFEGHRWRGYLYLYWGKADLALKEFVARYNEAPLEQKAVDEAIDDLVVALKAYCGHTLVAQQFMEYQKYGPKGKDGKLGTADDLTNPLQGIFDRK